jgi:pSer/pThr/pTyr-binding forkhead associated (FHA) protein
VGVSETIMLDQPTIIGRNPRAPGLPYGADARLVTVPSPELEVSSSHVEIQQVGEAVVVTDLRSTNGTFILHQDRAPERLRPGESRVLPAGAALDIGDGNIIEIAHIPPAR